MTTARHFISMYQPGKQWIGLGWNSITFASIQRIESFISLDARARYDTLQQTNPELIQRLPAKIIADYLGISQETLSRLKAKK